METVKANREYCKLNDIMSVMAFRAYKQNAAIIGVLSDKFDPIALVGNTFVLIENEFNLNRNWHDTWKAIELEKGIEIQPDFNGETRALSSKTACDISGFYEISAFCKKHGLEQSLENYVGVACRIFSDAKITLSIATDPEIEDVVKIKLNIDIESDFDSLFDLDNKFFEAVSIVVPEKDRDYFVKSYRLQSE